MSIWDGAGNMCCGREVTPVLHRKWIWASLTIVAMWLAVLVVGVFGPVLVAHGGETEVPVAALSLGLFAFLGTIAVAAFGFRGGEDEEYRAEIEAAREHREELEAREANLEQRLSMLEELRKPVDHERPKQSFSRT